MKIFLYHENGWRTFQAERLPIEPDPEDFPSEESYCYLVDKFNAEIAALKAKSIPVGNPDAFINTQGYWIDTKVGSNKPKDDEFYFWPGDVEIMMQEMGICNGFRYMDVAILTLPKEQ